MPSPSITDTVYAASRADWRRWLSRHYRTASEVWLVSYRKAAGRPGVAYADAVEEALCFGWIDSVRKRLDADRLAHRYTPRQPGSPVSQANRERLALLVADGRVAPDVLAALGDVRPEAFVPPPDVVAALQAGGAAWPFLQTCTPAYRRIRLAYVDAARARPDEFDKRLRHLVARSARGERFGYGIDRFMG